MNKTRSSIEQNVTKENKHIKNETKMEQTRTKMNHTWNKKKDQQYNNK